ncbi:MAG: hypothetical protein GC164_07625 [Phycisphaera sp.]|nr:hypothetical protein [Phycisphaera sp.]
MGLALSIYSLAQQGPTTVVAPPAPWWQSFITSALGLTILFIFLTTIITVIVQQRRKDKCLKLFNDHHVTFLSTVGRALWGDLRVHSKGLEFEYDAPYRTRRGLLKTGQLLYEQDLAACQVLCRTVHALSDKEKQSREAQIRRTFKPGLLRRFARRVRNVFNMLRDAFSKSLSVLIGQFAKVRADTAVASHQGDVNTIGQTLLGAAANAYEPMLERHIGQDVIVQLSCPADPARQSIELPGYLVDYTDRFVAIFSKDQTPLYEGKLEVGDEVIEQPWCKVTPTDDHVTVLCRGQELLVVHDFVSGDNTNRLDVVLANGAALSLPREKGKVVTLRYSITRQVDIVAPRSQAVVYYTSRPSPSTVTEDRSTGIAPECEEPEGSQLVSRAKGLFTLWKS